jgi:hypothetical protein
MKPLGKTSDGVADGPIDSLLRAYVSRPANRECSEFDADLANAYIERSLTPGAQSRYEQHLSECTPCRKNVVALTRLAAPESATSTFARADAGPGRRRIFGLSWGPRWAMAAVAVLVIAISLPLVLTRKTDRVPEETALAVNPTPPQQENQAASELRETTATPPAKVAATTSGASTEARQSEKAPVDAVSSNGPAPTQQPNSSGGGASTSGNNEAKPAAAAEQNQVSASPQTASDVAAQAQTKQADTQGVAGARQQQPAKDASADSKTKENEERDAKKEQVAERAEAVPPPAAPAAKSEDSRVDSKNEKMRHSAGRLALRDSSSAEAVRATEKVVSGKKFSLKNDTWTDKEFDPNKDLPVVTVVRGSNVYNELLAKRAGLKKYFDGIPATERAVIVYKGTVYKLIPQ